MKKLVYGDCMDLLCSIEDGCIDFSFYDPPYNVGKDYGVHKDNMDENEYIQWMADIIKQVRRVVKRGFGVYVGQNLTRLFFELLPDAHLIPVHKRAIGAMEGNYFLQYHSLFVVGKPVIKCKDLWDDIRLPGEGYFFREERFDHPGQTSIALVKKILYHFTVENDTILDPFLGVGTSAIAALSMGRSIVASENNLKYFEIAKKRVDELEMQPTLPNPSEYSWNAQNIELPLS